MQKGTVVPVQAMKEYGGVHIQLHTFLSGQLHYLSALPSGKDTLLELGTSWAYNLST